MNRFIYKLLIPVVTLVFVFGLTATAFAQTDEYLRISDSKGNAVATIRCSEGTASAGDLKSGTYHISVVDLEGKLLPVEASVTFELKMPGITIKAEGQCKPMQKPNSLEIDQIRKGKQTQNEFVVIEDGSSVSFTFAKPQPAGPLQAMQTK